MFAILQDVVKFKRCWHATLLYKIQFGRYTVQIHLWISVSLNRYKIKSTPWHFIEAIRHAVSYLLGYRSFVLFLGKSSFPGVFGLKVLNEKFQGKNPAMEYFWLQCRCFSVNSYSTEHFLSSSFWFWCYLWPVFCHFTFYSLTRAYFCFWCILEPIIVDEVFSQKLYVSWFKGQCQLARHSQKQRL